GIVLVPRSGCLQHHLCIPDQLRWSGCTWTDSASARRSRRTDRQARLARRVRGTMCLALLRADRHDGCSRGTRDADAARSQTGGVPHVAARNHLRRVVASLLPILDEAQLVDLEQCTLRLRRPTCDVRGTGGCPGGRLATRRRALVRSTPAAQERRGYRARAGRPCGSTRATRGRSPALPPPSSP